MIELSAIADKFEDARHPIQWRIGSLLSADERLAVAKSLRFEGPARAALIEARRQLILLGGDGREFGDCDAIQAAVLHLIDAALSLQDQAPK